MKRIIYLLALIGMLAFTASCENDTEVSTIQPQDQTINFDGTVLDFISQQNGYEGYGFDSLLYVLNRVEGIPDSLSQTSHQVTLFAAPNPCFELANQALKSYRTGMKLGDELDLDDLLIEPFEVVDTIVDFNPIAVSYDTTYVSRQYDYRESLRQLVGRYVFMQDIPTNQVIEGTYKSLFSRDMYLQVGNQDASGMVQAGKQYFQLIETRGSKQQAQWVKAEVSVCDIKCSNGYVHILAPRHEFGFNEITSYFANYGNEKKKK